MDSTSRLHLQGHRRVVILLKEGQHCRHLSEGLSIGTDLVSHLQPSLRHGHAGFMRCTTIGSGCISAGPCPGNRWEKYPGRAAMRRSASYSRVRHRVARHRNLLPRLTSTRTQNIVPARIVAGVEVKQYGRPPSNLRWLPAYSVSQSRYPPASTCRHRLRCASCRPGHHSRARMGSQPAGPANQHRCQRGLRVPGRRSCAAYHAEPAARTVLSSGTVAVATNSTPCIFT